MAFGLDYVSGPPIPAMKAAGVSFVCRYTGYFSGYKIEHVDVPQGKVLTPGEAAALSKAGIALVSNWEWSANRAVQGHAEGVWDAQTADKIHRACGGPADRPIYFSIDVDVAESQVLAYFQGVASVLGLARTGAYGSYRVIKALFDVNAIAWGWQTYAWSYGAREGRAHLYQYENSVSLAGHGVDYNHSLKADFGQWFSGGEEHMSIDINTPGVAAEFKEVDATHWQSLRTGKVIQHGLLAAYKKYGNGGMCGLAYLGHPETNEQPIAPGKVRQRFDYGVLAWREGVGVYPLALYTGSDGEDPRVKDQATQIATLQAQLLIEQQKTAPADPVAQQKIDRYDAIAKIVSA
jgi:glycoside hydrolase-like protein